MLKWAYVTCYVTLYMSHYYNPILKYQNILTAIQL